MRAATKQDLWDMLDPNLSNYAPVEHWREKDTMTHELDVQRVMDELEDQDPIGDELGKFAIGAMIALLLAGIIGITIDCLVNWLLPVAKRGTVCG